MQKAVQLVCSILIAAIALFGARWYMYIAQAQSPYDDEVGIALNGYAPAPLRRWGCHKMQQRFADQIPPYGCAGPDGRNWM